MCKKIFNLPQVKVTLTCNDYTRHRTTLLAMAGGREPDSIWLNNLVKFNSSDNLYAADKGAKYFLGNNLIPQLVLGDADSAGKEIFQQAKALGSEVFAYPTEKDDTDLQLLLKKLPVGDVVISGIWGGRFDHLYSNVFSLAKAALDKLGLVIMADSKELMFILKESEELKLSFLQPQALEAISLLALTENTTVSMFGVHWPLNNQALNMYRPYAISNVLEGEPEISCACHSGIVGLYCSFR